MELVPWKAILAIAALLGIVIWTEQIVAYNPPPGPVHVVYWEKWTGFEGDAMRAVVNDFNRSQSKIFVDLLTVSGIENKTLMAVAGGEPPDLAGLYGPNVAQYADDEAIFNLDSFCKEAGITPDQYVPAFIDIGIYNGHIYALPSVPASTALHYNKKMLRDAGLDPDKPPQTIEELDAFSDKITKKVDGKIIKAGYLPAEPGWWNWSWGYFFGGKLWDGKSKITANSKENIRAFEWIKDLSTKYGSQNLQSFKGGFGTFNSPQNAFLDEQVAMEGQGVWMANFISQYSPNLEWGAVAFPHPADRPDLANTTIADEDVLVIPRGARHPKEAFEFVKFVQSPHGMEELCLLQKKNSALKQVSAEFYAKHPNPYIRLFSDLPKGPNTIATPKMGIWVEYRDAMNTAFDEVSLLQKTPKEALDEVQEQIQRKLDEHLDILRKRGQIQ